jgi:hypothetical protein
MAKLIAKTAMPLGGSDLTPTGSVKWRISGFALIYSCYRLFSQLLQNCCADYFCMFRYLFRKKPIATFLQAIYMKLQVTKRLLTFC